MTKPDISVSKEPFVIVMTKDGGNFAGHLSSHDISNNIVILSEARRMWTPKNMDETYAAIYGPTENFILSPKVDIVLLKRTSVILFCSKEAREIIKKMPSYIPNK